ncbi:MAG: SCO family protein [Sulfuricella sp.]|nr:SCO family protein [Sulfuricella sp.]
MRFLAVILFFVSLCALAGAAETAKDDDQPEVGVVSRYLLMDVRGRAISDQDFRGRYQLLAFGYTFCPDICPTTLAEMSLVLEKLGKQAERVQPLFVTVDPERDTPEVLQRYTGFFDKRIIGLTGSPDLVRRVANHFKVRYEKHREPGAAPGQYTVDHSAGMYLLGPDGSFIAKFAYAQPPSEIAARLKALMD